MQTHWERTPESLCFILGYMTFNKATKYSSDYCLSRRALSFSVGMIPRETTHQLIVVFCLIHSARVREEQQLRVGVDGEVKLNWVLVATQKVGHGLGLWLRLWERSAVDLHAGIIRSSLRWRKRDLFTLERPLMLFFFFTVGYLCVRT